MRIPFYKYQATANDFIIINQIMVPYLREPDTSLIKGWCDRRFGIGADGLMLIVPAEEADFEMIYYNSDGRLSSMCGNGGRAISHLAHSLKIMGKEGRFEAVDGLHEVKLAGEQIHLKMSDVVQVDCRVDQYVLDTGSPHIVNFTSGVDDLNLVKKAREIRYNEEFSIEGINVNYVEITEDGIQARTYERGVEDETYSCGTGVVASAIAYSLNQNLSDGPVQVQIITRGGPLTVKFNLHQRSCSDIWLIGPAELVYEGVVDL